jgi:hypothetical protein
MGNCRSHFIFIKMIPFQEGEFHHVCCHEECGQVYRYHLLFEERREKLIYNVTMSFCLLKNRMRLFRKDMSLCEIPYQEEEIEDILRTFALSCLMTWFPSIICFNDYNLDYKIIFHQRTSYFPLQAPKQGETDKAKLIE